MATKTFKGRIQNKHDTEANWNAAVNFKPLAGELIIYDEDNTHSTPRFKVGDGNTLVSNLPFYPSGDVTATGSNTFTGSNKFTQKPRFNSGFQLGFTASAPEVNDLWEIDKEGFKAAGSSLSTQTIKFPDLSTFFTANHTIPLNDTDNTFTGTNTFNNGEFRVVSSYGIAALNIDPLGPSGTSHTGMTTLKSAIDQYCSIDLGAGSLSINSIGTNNNTGHIDISTGANGVDFNIAGVTSALKVLSDGIKVNSKTKYCGGKIDNIVSGTTYSLSLPSKSGTLITTADIMVASAPDKAGSAGLVPAPAAGDQLKYLRGDGTWSDYNLNTANSTDTSSKIYLIGAREQTTFPQTYSHDTAYVGTDGCLYSNSKKVATVGDNNTFTGSNTFTGDFSRKTRDSSGAMYYKESISDQGFTVGVGSTEAASNTQAIYGWGHIKVTAGAAGTVTLDLPVKTGTLALTSDIPIKTATLSGTTLSITLS